MTEKIGNIKTAYELAALLKQLPEREQIQVEGVIVGLRLAQEQPRSDERQGCA